jgi:cysteine desulfurase
LGQARIYLDHAATTPVLPAAREAMVEALARWHNPSSPHSEGRAAKAALEHARERIATVFGWPGKIVFTSGASEALAIALQRGKGGPAFVSAVEHDAVLRSAPDAARLPVDQHGIVLLPQAGPEHVYAIQHANNETGVIQPLGELAPQVRERGGILIADCAQTAGKIPLPEADIIAVSAHKFGGPPGIGALLLKDFAPIEAVGGQEQGYRPGTENLPAILGMAAALEAGRGWTGRAADLRHRLEQRLLSAGAEVVGAGSDRLPTIGAYRMPGIPSNAQLIQFDMAGIAVSAGSACSSGSLKPSHVLAAMGWDDAAAREVIRVSFGRSTTEDEIDRFADLWTAMAAKRRAA